MPHAYTDDQFAEKPATGLFADLGWAVAWPPPNTGVSCEPRDAGLPGRETKGKEVWRRPSHLFSRLQKRPLALDHNYPRSSHVGL